MLLVSDYYQYYQGGQLVQSHTAWPFWAPGDTLEQFQRNSLQQPSHWPYHHRQIRYTLNSWGYRCPEFNSIDWANSIVAFGCSFTFGIGVDDDETWCHQLSLLLDLPVINLAQPGSSTEFQYLNYLRLRARGIQPRAVVYAWPPSLRWCEPYRPGGARAVVRHFGPWSWSGGAEFSDQQRSRLQFPQYYQQRDQQLKSQCSWPCPRFDFTHDRGYPQGLPLAPEIQDRGRDLVHPGPLSQRATALWLYPNLTALIQ